MCIFGKWLRPMIKKYAPDTLFKSDFAYIWIVREAFGRGPLREARSGLSLCLFPGCGIWRGSPAYDPKNILL